MEAVRIAVSNCHSYIWYRMWQIH